MPDASRGLSGIIRRLLRFRLLLDNSVVGAIALNRPAHPEAVEGNDPYLKSNFQSPVA